MKLFLVIHAFKNILKSSKHVNNVEYSHNT